MSEKIDPIISRDTEVAVATGANLSQIQQKVNKAPPTFTGLSDGFAKVTSNLLSGGHTITDADLSATIARDSEVATAIAGKVDKSTPIFIN